MSENCSVTKFILTNKDLLITYLTPLFSSQDSYTDYVIVI